MNRVWDDVNFDGIVQGDPLIVEANGELIRNDGNPAFGLPVVTALVDSDWATGFGERAGNWEYSVSMQRELMPNMSLNVAYFYRTFVNFNVTDTLALGPDDYDTFSVTVPLDPGLPSGGGNVVSGLLDRKLGALGRAPDSLRTGAGNFGGQSQNWRGIDISVNARLEDLLCCREESAQGARRSTAVPYRRRCRRRPGPASSARAQRITSRRSS